VKRLMILAVVALAACSYSEPAKAPAKHDSVAVAPKDSAKAPKDSAKAPAPKKHQHGK
jgi:hypothetical protein